MTVGNPANFYRKKKNKALACALARAYSFGIDDLGIWRFWKTCGFQERADEGLGVFSPMAAG